MSGASFESMLSRQLPALEAFVRLRGGNEFRARESCSDLVQSVLRETLERMQREGPTDPDSVRRLLFRKARDKLADRRAFHHAECRRVSREVHSQQSDACMQELARAAQQTPSRAAITREELAAIERAFDALADVDRDVISLAKLAGLSHDAIAEELDMSRANVASRLHRALGRLRYQLTKGES